ncbi:MAG: TRIC cation channel family protein [Lachnospiraceae bacterium]|nr:TRIC cation channel family protein [Lachnospiraceae bacterium]
MTTCNHITAVININSSDSLMTLIYWFGLITCVVSGYHKGKNFCQVPIFHFLINSFGGGLARDVLIMNTKVWLFTLDAIPDILYVLLIGILYSKIAKEYTSRELLICDSIVGFIDALSVGSFAAIGIDKAYSLGYDSHVAIISGYVTACWGGVLANFLQLYTVITASNMYYHFVVFISCILYSHLQNGYILCTLISIGLLADKINYRILFTYNHVQFISVFVKFNLETIIQSIQACFAKTHNHVTNRFFFKHTNCLRVYIVLHRIRLC